MCCCHLKGRISTCRSNEAISTEEETVCACNTARRLFGFRDTVIKTSASEELATDSDFWTRKTTMYRKQMNKDRQLHGVCSFVRNHTVDLVDGGGERAKPDLFGLIDELWSGLFPLLGDLQILVCVDQQVKSTCFNTNSEVYCYYTITFAFYMFSIEHKPL